MFDTEENTFWNNITFTYSDGDPDGTSKSIKMTLVNKECYPDILQQMVYFLQAIGYTYIDGLVAINENGEDLKSSLEV